MTRWKAALGGLWRSEPALPLALYFLLIAASTGYISLAGGHLPGGLRVPADRDMSIGDLAVYAFLTWRMWLGGGYSWTLSVVGRLLFTVATVYGCYHAHDLFAFGLLALTLASLVPLFAAAVLDRVTDRSYKFTIPRAVRSAFLEGYQGPSRHDGPLPTGRQDGAAV